MKAKELFEKACQGNDGEGCFYLGNLYRWGDGVQQDYAKAKELFEKSCDELNWGRGCHGLALLFYVGQGVDQDLPRAAARWKQACDLGRRLWSITLKHV